jgi:transposase
MSTAKRRIFNREFKRSAIERLIAGESAAALCRELRIHASYLSKWSAHLRRDGPEGLRRAGRPRKLPSAVELDPVARAKAKRANDLAVARKRIAELECKVGQQQVELDFFQEALRHVGEARRPNDGPGVKASTPSSRR